MGKRFAIVIGVAAAGVMALGAQTALAAPDVVKYDTELTITTDRGSYYHGSVLSDRDRNPGYDPANAVRECMGGRRLILFKVRPGADRKLDTLRSQFRPDYGEGIWGLPLRLADDFRRRELGPSHARVYAKVTPKVGDGFVCRADRSPTSGHPRSLGAQTALAGGEPVDSTPPDLQLSGPKKVSLHPEVPGQGRPWVLVKASCGKVNGPPASPLESVPPEPWAANLPDTACTLSAEGKVMGDELKPLDELHPPEGDLLGPPQVFCVPELTTCHWQSGGTLYLNLKLTKKTLKQARKALDAGKKVRAKDTVEATDAAGNKATAKRTIKLVK